MANSRSDSSFAVGGRPFRGSHRLLLPLLLFLLMPQLPIWLEGTCHDGVGVGMTSSPPLPFPPPPLRYLLVSQLAGGEVRALSPVMSRGQTGNGFWLALSLSPRLLPLHIWNRQGPPYTSPPPSSHSGETSSVGPEHADRRDRSSTSYT